MYPANFGLVRISKITASLTFFEYLQYTAEIRSGSGADTNTSNNICMIWATTYNSGYPNRVMTWNKSLSTETEAQQIIRSKIRINAPTNWEQYIMQSALGYYRAVEADDSRIRLDVRDTNTTDERRYFDFLNKIGASSVADALKIVDVKDNTSTAYRVYGQHNLATQAEAEAGTENDKPMTPLRVKQAIAALAGKSTWTISQGTNGWARESSTGFTIQWGTIACNLARATAIFTFPRTFSSVYSVVATSTSYPVSGAGVHSIIALNETTATVYGDYTHDTVASSARIIAVGIS